MKISQSTDRYRINTSSVLRRSSLAAAAPFPTDANCRHVRKRVRKSKTSVSASCQFRVRGGHVADDPTITTPDPEPEPSLPEKMRVLASRETHPAHGRATVRTCLRPLTPSQLGRANGLVFGKASRSGVPMADPFGPYAEESTSCECVTQRAISTQSRLRAEKWYIRRSGERWDVPRSCGCG